MLSTCLLILLAAPPTASDKVTSKNWRHHPAIADARAVYEEVRAALDGKRLRREKREAEDECWDWYALEVGTDTSSTVRYFARSGGGQDSIHEHAFFYDRAGHLRFALMSGKAGNGSSIETRVWLDGKGRELYRRDATRGPGWTWISRDPTSLIRTPAAMFAADDGACRLGPPRTTR